MISSTPSPVRITLALVVLLAITATAAARSQSLRRDVLRAPAPQSATQEKLRFKALAKAQDAARVAASGQRTGARTSRRTRASASVTPAGSEVEPNGTVATASPVTLNAGHGLETAALSPDGDVDFYSFTATAGDRVWVHTDTGGTQSAGANSRDTVIDLIAPDGTTVIESDDDDGTGTGRDGTIESELASVIAGREVGVTGTYYVRVRAFSATASINPYSLFVTVTSASVGSEAGANDTPATAEALYAGSAAVIESQISPAADVDVYALQLAGPGTLSIDADADPERDGSGTDLVLNILAPDGKTSLLQVDASASGSVANPAAEEAAYTFAAGGTYYVRVRHFSASGTGTYSLLVTGQSCGLVCPANITVSSDPNQCGSVVNYPAPTSDGTCGTITCSPASGSFFPVGTTTVTCTATVGDTCVFTITVNDTQAPTITCPANITVSSDPNQCGTVVNYPGPTLSDNCPGVTAICSPASGSFFPVGVTTVTCTATDASGNTASCTFTITVNDTQAPSITCPANITVSSSPNQCGAVVNYPAPTTSDTCPGVSVVCSPASGSFFPVGTTTVTCTATDTSANTASCTFTIRVNDTQAPVINCPSSFTAFQDSAFGGVVTYSVQTSDNCPGVITSCTPASGSVFHLGATTVNCTATDAAGNTSTCSFTVTVVPPPSTAGTVVANGTLRLAQGRRALFAINARAGGVAPSGPLVYEEVTGGKLFQSTQITAIVISGNAARIFGKGVLRRQRKVLDFVVDVQDIAQPGTNRDKFRIEMSNGYTVPLTPIVTGEIKITRR